MTIASISTPALSTGTQSAALPAPALEMRQVHKGYGAVKALQPTSFRIEKGEVLTLLGPSGSGKSTLLGLAAGIVSPDGGTIHFNGEDVTDRPPHLRGVGMVFQRYTLFPNKTVAENIAFPLEVRKRPKAEIAERVAHFLDLVSLSKEADRYPSQISGGQAQRVALARALVFEPALLLMDEPLGALDRRLRQTLQDEIRRIQQATRVPTLYVTHDQEEAMHLSDRIAVVRDGRIAAIGAPREIYDNPASRWIAAFLGDVNARDVERWHEANDGYVKATLAGGIDAVARVSGDAREAARAALVVRPERCVIVPRPTQPLNSFRGTVVATSFLGPVQRVRVATDAGWEVLAGAPGHAAAIAAGSLVHVEFEPDAALIVPQL